MTVKTFQKSLRNYISGEWENGKMLLYPNVKDFLSFEELRGNLLILKNEDCGIFEKVYVRLRSDATVDYVIWVKKERHK